MKKLVTAESVGEGHPDKICDQVSDAILDDLLRQDPDSRVAVECLTKSSMIITAGEVKTKGYCDVQKVVRGTLKEIGYTDPKFGIDFEDCAVLVAIQEQSPDISQGVTATQDKEQGAGDQGMMYGYACKETPELMPMPIMLSHKLVEKLSEVRKSSKIKGLGPDCKSQVTVEYQDNMPKRVHTVVIAQQHTDDIQEQELRKEILEHVIKPVLGNLFDQNTVVHINATGRFVIGGPEGDSGVTGRKIIVDSYGGGRHGGGAFSGKDPSKVDRSAAYMARYVAKNLVAAGISDEIEIQIAYVIGVASPVSINVQTFGRSKYDEEKIVEIIKKVFPLKPAEIIKHLDLKRPIYKKTACFGHFGRQEPEFTWEKLDKVDEIKKLL
jgi:S-adenosylmethionine synthetase